jgi:hypothetical protein
MRRSIIACLGLTLLVSGIALGAEREVFIEQFTNSG